MIKLDVPLLQTVKRLLLNEPRLRDNDNALAVAVWQYYHKELRSAHMTFLMFAHNLSLGKYIAYESIRRTRQKVQEEWPKTRGELYEKRRLNQDAIKEELASAEFKAGGTP